jgi:hypothetical protein
VRWIEIEVLEVITDGQLEVNQRICIRQRLTSSESSTTPVSSMPTSELEMPTRSGHLAACFFHQPGAVAVVEPGGRQSACLLPEAHGISWDCCVR